jgi:hypothetical protein
MRGTLLSIVLLALSSLCVMGQSSPVIKASTDGSQLHITAPAKAVQIKVEGISENGERLFEAAANSNTLDLRPSLSSDGVYLCVISVQSADGSVKRGKATMSVRSGRLGVQSATAGLNSAQQQAVGASETSFDLMVIPEMTGAPSADRAENITSATGETTSDNPAAIRPTLSYINANFIQYLPGTAQLSVGDANGTAPMLNLRGQSTCCGPTVGFADFKVFQNGSFVHSGNLGIGVSPMQGKGYRTSWDSYKGAFRSGYADLEWDDANVGFFSWAGGSNSTALGLYSLAFGDTNFAESTSSIVFGSGNQVKGAAGFSAGSANRVCDTWGVALGNKAQSGGPLINGKCDPDSFNIHGLVAVAIGSNVTADQDYTTAMGKYASNNGFAGTFIWSDGSANAAADTFRNTANNEFAARATGGFRFRTNLTGTTGCNLPAGSGVFNCTSSRTTKENFQNVSNADVLSKIRKLPVSSWNYIAEGQESRHLGPMAEDFYSTFRLGTSDKSIGIQDLAGVSLAGVKALEERTADLQTENTELKEKLNSVQDQLKRQQAEIDELKKLVLAGKTETDKK